MEKGYKNVGFILVLLIPLTLVGFYKTYLGHFPYFENNPGIAIHFHFAVMGFWIVLFIVQPILIRSKKHRLHRLLGKFSYVLFVLILISFLPLYIAQINGDFLALTVLTTFDIILLIVFYSLAIYYKSQPQLHMRYMITLTLLFALPALGRINSRWLDFRFIENMHIGFGIVCLILLSLIAKDKINKSKNYFPYVVGISGFVIRQAAIYLAYYTII